MKASASRDLGAGFKLLYSGGNIVRNRVGIVIHPALVPVVKDILRVSDRLIAVTLQVQFVSSLDMHHNKAVMMKKS